MLSRFDFVDITATPCVARPLAAMILAIWNRQVLEVKYPYGHVKLWTRKFSRINKLHFLRCMDKIFSVEFPSKPLKFQTKYFTHTLNATNLFSIENSRALRLTSSYAFLKRTLVLHEEGLQLSVSYQCGEITEIVNTYLCFCIQIQHVQN